ncbi:hypothetical protein [Nonomuraea dietziae]|uniref:Uncharacterized protein n=1 Tax=Nonomuraea dietziae TaxID=65515 RepID=A0A7W5Y9J3_9ACTN|nr:hypothetical protein [Nonomuraea dietziae]MBB3729546.1 hypothetical protein [Nonomuraea dietziae]
MRKLITEVSAVVEASADDVERELRKTLGGELAHQGGWWYRGEWSVEPHPRGALVVHRVYNVAEWMRWAVPLANQFFISYEEATREAFHRGLASLRLPPSTPA